MKQKLQKMKAVEMNYCNLHPATLNYYLVWLTIF